jgi:putative YhbY family RNA-binding protein
MNAMKPLTPSERRSLRAKAHHLDPVVIVGQHGLTPPVVHEIDLALTKHELVKVRVFSDDRDARAAMLARMCADVDCAEVQHLGKVFVLWRPNPDKKNPAPPPATRTKPRNDHFTRGLGKKAGPRTPVDPVRERRRTVQGEGAALRSGRGRRGAARHESLADESAAAPVVPATRKKSSYTPKTKPKSFSAKPNPRSAWEKKKSAAAGTDGTKTRRRRTGA